MKESRMENNAGNESEYTIKLKEFVSQILSAIESYQKLAVSSDYPEAKHNLDCVAQLQKELIKKQDDWNKVLELLDVTVAELKILEVSEKDEQRSGMMTTHWVKRLVPEVCQIQEVLQNKLYRGYKIFAQIQTSLLARTDLNQVTMLQKQLSDKEQELKSKKAELKKELSVLKEKKNAKITELQKEVETLKQRVAELSQENATLKDKYHVADKDAAVKTTELKGKDDLLHERDKRLEELAETKDLTRQLILSNQQIAQGQLATIHYIQHGALPEMTDEELLQNELGEYQGKDIKGKITDNHIMSTPRLELVIKLMTQYKEHAKKQCLQGILRLITESIPMTQIIDAKSFRVTVPKVEDKLDKDSMRVLKYAACLALYVVDDPKLAVLIVKNQEKLAELGVRALFADFKTNGATHLADNGLVDDDEVLEINPNK